MSRSSQIDSVPRMTCSDLIDFIQRNHLESAPLMVCQPDFTYLTVTGVRESEARGGSVLLDTAPDRPDLEGSVTE